MAAIIISRATGHLGWSETSTILRENAATLYPFIIGDWIPVSKFNFGIGLENCAICPECNRKIPIATSTVDHKIPQSWMTYSQVEIISTSTFGVKNFEYNGSKFTVRDKGLLSIIYSDNGDAKRGASYVVHTNRRTIEVTIGVQKYHYDIVDVLKNNLSNLQYMCHSCNAKKGAR